jgi:hypothetical protein
MTTTTPITADEILACDPCSDWPPARIRALVGDGIAPAVLARHPDVPRVDRRWVLTQVLARRDRRALVHWACDCCDCVAGVRRLLPGGTAADLAVKTARAWCEGAATAEDCRAAWATTRAVAYATAPRAAYAIWAAADVADAASADDDAWAARAAARAAAAAAWAAARAEATQAQLDALAAYYTKG